MTLPCPLCVHVYSHLIFSFYCHCSHSGFKARLEQGGGGTLNVIGYTLGLAKIPGYWPGNIGIWVWIHLAGYPNPNVNREVLQVLTFHDAFRDFYITLCHINRQNNNKQISEKLDISVLMLSVHLVYRYARVPTNFVSILFLPQKLKISAQAYLMRVPAGKLRTRPGY